MQAIRKYYPRTWWDACRCFLMGLTLLFYGCLLLVAPFSFNYQFDIHAQYFLFPVALLAPILWQLPQLRKNGRIDTLQIAGTAILFAMLPLFFLSNYYNESNEHFTYAVSIVLIAIPLSQSRVQSLKLLWLFIAFFCLAELAIGIWSSRPGTLQNKGIYACFLVIHLPLAHYYLLSAKQMNCRKWIATGSFFVFAISTLSIAVLALSRTAILTFIAISLYLWLPLRGRLVPRRATFFVLAAAVLIWLGKYLLSIKTMSTSGRWLMWHVTLDHLWENFCFGTGMGRFTWSYPRWQAQYFREHAIQPLNSYLSAGESYVVFNEFLQLLKEIGILGFTIFLAIVISFFCLRSKEHAGFLRMLKGTVIGILSCGFTSYPFHTTPFLFLFIICLAGGVSCLSVERRIFRKKYYLLVSPIGLLLTAFVFFQSTQKAASAKKWSKLEHSIDLSPSQKIDIYKSLLPEFRTDGKFLAEYGEALSTEPRYLDASRQVFMQGTDFFISCRAISDAAVVDEQLGNLSAAIGNYSFLAHYIPSRFYPKYNLARLYRRIGDTAHAKAFAAAILDMPVKIPSPEVDNIKKEMRQYLHRQ